MHTWLEISRKSIEHNITQFRKLIGKDRLLMLVVKSNAYGHGFLSVAQICDKNRAVDRLCVVSDDEALELIKNKIKKPIMILSFYELDAKKLLILAKRGVIFPLFSLEQARLLNRVGEMAKKPIKAHIKIDTGASRVGILPPDLKDFIKTFKNYKKLEIEGIWSHFASSEEDAEYTKKQYNYFLYPTGYENKEDPVFKNFVYLKLKPV